MELLPHVQLTILTLSRRRRRALLLCRGQVAATIDPRSASYALGLVHGREVAADNAGALNAAREYLSRNSTAGVGRVGARNRYTRKGTSSCGSLVCFVFVCFSGGGGGGGGGGRGEGAGCFWQGEVKRVSWRGGEFPLCFIRPAVQVLTDTVSFRAPHRSIIRQVLSERTRPKNLGATKYAGAQTIDGRFKASGADAVARSLPYSTTVTRRSFLRLEWAA